MSEIIVKFLGQSWQKQLKHICTLQCELEEDEEEADNKEEQEGQNGRGREIACSKCAAHEKRLAFSIFVSLFWLFGSLTA